MSLNWLRQRKNVVIPIIGARRAAQVEDNLKSLDWQLTDEQLAKLDDATKIELGFPHDFLTNDFLRQMVFGGTHASYQPSGQLIRPMVLPLPSSLSCGPIWGS